MKFAYPHGSTPINPDEATGLIPAHITLQRELDEYEEANILEATLWAFARRRGDVLDMNFVHEVHRRMFSEVWRWAGKSRRSEKNIGVPWIEIPIRLRDVLDDTRAQIEHHAYLFPEIAARFHHRLVTVHVFPNGNGRHARLMADLLLDDLAGQRLHWGHDRVKYIVALQAADNGDIQPLLDFCGIRSA